MFFQLTKQVADCCHVIDLNEGIGNVKNVERFFKNIF